MPDSLYAKENKTEDGLNKESRDKKEDLRPDQLAIELAREWNSPGEWVQQHLYVE